MMSLGTFSLLSQPLDSIWPVPRNRAWSNRAKFLIRCMIMPDDNRNGSCEQSRR
jgi:hypothetical protein